MFVNLNKIGGIVIMKKQKDNSHFLKYCNCDYEKRGV